MKPYLEPVVHEGEDLAELNFYAKGELNGG